MSDSQSCHACNQPLRASIAERLKKVGVALWFVRQVLGLLEVGDSSHH